MNLYPRVLQLSVSDSGFGGANRAAYRIHQAIRDHSPRDDVLSRMRVIYKHTLDPSVTGGFPLNYGFWYSFLRPKVIRLAKKRFGIDSNGFLSIGWPMTGLGKEISSFRRFGDINIIHCHALDNAVLSIAELGALPFPVVWTLHDQWAFCDGEHYRTSARPYVLDCPEPSTSSSCGEHSLHRWVWRRKLGAWSSPMHLVAPSSWMATCAQRSTLMGHWPVRVIPNPIDLTFWAPVERRQARSLLNLPLDSPLILFGAAGGTSDPRKGGSLLLEALYRLRTLIDNGDAPEPYLAVFGQSRADPSFDPPFSIRYLGHISDELHLRLLYAAADVFVIPSRQDNLPNTGLEAHACGTPVVAFRVGGLVDIVDHGVTGFLAEPFSPQAFAQAIHSVLFDPERSISFGAAARCRAESLWSPQRIADLYVNLYSQIIEQFSTP